MFAFIFLGIIISEIVSAQKKVQSFYFNILELEEFYCLSFLYFFHISDDAKKEMMICEKWQHSVSQSF